MATWQVREATVADYAGIRACMVDILQETEGQKTTGFGQEFWEWQYLKTEEPSLIVVAEDGGIIRGYFHIVMLPVRYHGRRVLGGLIQDVATLKAYRREGTLPAMNLFARDLLWNRGGSFVFGFPNYKSAPIFGRVYHTITTVPVHVRPLDLGRVLADRFGTAAGMVGTLAGPLYRALLVRRMPLARGEDVVALNRFDEEAEQVAREFAEPAVVFVERTARFLNWRFVEKPTREYGIWGLRRDGRLRAYLVTRTGTLYGTRCVIVMDLGCLKGEEPALLRLLAARLAAEQLTSATACVLEGLHPFFQQLRRLGFVRVPDRYNPRRVIFQAGAPAPDMGTDLFEAQSWFVSLADWDVI